MPRRRQKLKKNAKLWEQEISKMSKTAEKKEAALKAEEVLLTQEMKADRQQAIDLKWQEVQQYRKKVFGFDGLYFLKKKELIKPVQDKVFEAVEKVSKKHKLDFVIDKSGSLVLIYTNPVHDYTDYVLEVLGLGDKNDTIEQ